MQKRFLTRRRFLESGSMAAAALSFAGCAQPKPQRSANEKLNIGFIGAGGRANENIAALASENIVALCDVDEKNAAASFAKYPSATRYRDFRKMLDQEKSLDAVVVSTPDHIHAIAAITAMRHRSEE